MQPRRRESKFILVTPETAKVWLGQNTNNRPLSDQVVCKYAEQMDRGEWISNGEPIIFSSDGRLHDGQHRLEAICLAGKPVEMLVVTGIDDPDAFKTYNQGKPRSKGDIFAIAGEKNSGLVVSILHLVIAHEGGRLKCTRLNTTQGARLAQTTSTQQMFAHLAKHPGVRDSAEIAQAYRRKQSVLTGTIFGFLHYTLGKIDREEAETFLDGVCFGAGLDTDSPVLALRNLILNNKLRRAVMPPQFTIAAAFLAWNKHREGTKAPFIRINEGAEFPVPK